MKHTTESSNTKSHDVSLKVFAHEVTPKLIVTVEVATRGPVILGVRCLSSISTGTASPADFQALASVWDDLPTHVEGASWEATLQDRYPRAEMTRAEWVAHVWREFAQPRGWNQERLGAALGLARQSVCMYVSEGSRVEPVRPAATTPPPTPEGKCCPKCGETKPLAQFSRDKSRRDGRQVRCKDCQNLASEEWRKANPERDRERQRNWRAGKRAATEDKATTITADTLAAIVDAAPALTDEQRNQLAYLILTNGGAA